MSTGKSGDTSSRYSDICGATNNRGEPCGLPAGWGTPGSGGERCKFHGGASTGPTDTEHLEDNDFAEGNAGGGAPELNTNAATAHGMWGDWRKVYDRLPEERKDYVDRLASGRVEKTKPYTPDMDADRRERLALEYTVLREIQGRVDYDIFAGFAVQEDKEPAEDARGFAVKEEVEIDGETYEIDKRNPALDRRGEIAARRRRIERELNLAAVWQRKEPPQSEDGRTLAEALSED